MKLSYWIGAAAIGLIAATPAMAQSIADGMVRTPDRRAGEGIGPFPTLVIQNAMLIDGTGAPPRGPVDIMIEGNRIAAIGGAGSKAPEAGAHLIDAKGMYVLPGFVDTHGHNGDPGKAPDPSYGYKLWLAHGVTTVRGLPFNYGPGNQDLADKRRSATNSIVAPRLFSYPVIGDVWDGGAVDTADKARAWVRWIAKTGYDGMKLFAANPPEVTEAALDEAKKLGLGSVGHLSQAGVAEINAARAGELGLATVTHFYGHFESLLKDRAVPDYPADYNMHGEEIRFFEVSRLADQIVEPGGPQWQDYLTRQLANGVTFNPTLNIYSASRDVMRARTADWHAGYTLPSLWAFFQPSRDNHGSYFYDWTTAKEVSWRRFYQPYMKLMNDYKNLGGRVTVGSDPGFIYQSWGFSYIGELEMLQEAGFSTLEVIRAATRDGAAEIYEPKGVEPPFGTVRVGKLADLVIVPENPLQNLKTLYGTGTPRLGADGRIEQAGGVRYTIKDGIIYDAKALLADVAAMVAEEKARAAQ